MTDVLINPPAAAFGRVNALLNARAARHHHSRFAGPLSVKAVISGRATWETAGGRYELGPGAVLLLNDGEEYSITVDALQPVETFCFFFARGFVEDAYAATLTGSARLLDGDPRLPTLHFAERLQFGALAEEVRRAHMDCGGLPPLSLDHEKRQQAAAVQTFYAIALQLVRLHADVDARVANLPSLRAATREELARRLEVATSYLHANSARGVTIAEAARAACLSPFHFHRLFTRFHGITPHRYLTRLRLERARSLLGTGGSVLDVAIACGFESLGSFSALYKKTFDTTPGAAKKQESRNASAAGNAILRT